MEPIPSQITIGKENKKGDKFNDGTELTKAGGAINLQAIKVYFDQKGIIGFTFHYKLADQSFQKADHNVPKNPDKVESRFLDIGPDDALKEIAGHFDEYLRRITFTTYRGKCLNVGSDMGAPFQHKIENYSFLAASGCFKKYFEHLQFTVVPLSQDFLNQFKPIKIDIKVNQVRQQPVTQPQNYQGYFIGNQPQAHQFAQVQQFSVNQPQLNYPVQQPNNMYNQPQNQNFAPNYQQQQNQQPVKPEENLTASKYPDLFKK